MAHVKNAACGDVVVPNCALHYQGGNSAGSRRRFHTLPYRSAQQRTMLATNQRDIIQPNPKSIGQIDLRLDGWVEVGVKIVFL